MMTLTNPTNTITLTFALVDETTTAMRDGKVTTYLDREVAARTVAARLAAGWRRS